jgi:ribonucleoside-diphosphate reductase alpha chain/ribonucleoside-diphosphate reductase subunit M1
MLKIFKNDILEKLSSFTNLNNINVDQIADKVISMVYDDITPDEIDNLIAEICINMSTLHPDYSYLAGKILILNLHNKTLNNFTSKMKYLSENTNQICEKWLEWILLNENEINQIIDYSRDYNYDYFGFKTLEKAYLLKCNKKIIERPQDMILRTAITLQIGNLELIKKTYDFMSLGYYTHATPTLFNSGTKHMQLSSCFIENTEVITMTGVKKIINVEINDEIITHTGQIKKVLQFHKNKLNDRKLMLLKVYNTKDINVTDNHRFWSISDNDYIPNWRAINELNNTHMIAVPSYKGNSLKKEFKINQIFNNINIDHKVKINIDDKNIEYYYLNNLDNKIINDNKKHLNNIIQNNLLYYILFNDNLLIDKNISKLFGLYLNCGYKLNKLDGITFIIPKMYTFLKNNSSNKIINFICDTIKKYFFLDVIIYNTNDNYELCIYSIHLSILFDYIFNSQNNHNIYLNMIHWSNELLLYFKEGLEFNNKNIYNNELYHIFRLHGINYFYKTIKEDNINIKIIDDILYLRVLSITANNLNPEYVYTLGVEDDHSYNVEGLLCENCFLLGTNDDLIDICKSWNSCSQISKWAGGIGIHLSNIRSKNSLIKGTNGNSSGLIPLLKIYNDIARWIDQGGKRPGSIAVYLEPHHPDIFEFIELRKNFGSENDRARDLFLALWVSDLFMKQIDNDSDWYLLSPDDCPNLNNVYGDEFEKLYWKYVNEKKYRNVVKARKLWMHILDAQIETGLPYICYKDSINRKNNQKNIGIIKSSNLCAEIVEYSDNDEYAVCNLASIALKSYIIPFKNNNNDKWIIYSKDNCKYCIYAKKYLENLNILFDEYKYTEHNLIKLKKILDINITYPQIFIESNNELKHIGGWNELYNYTAATFDYDKLYEVAYLATVNLNQVIDINYYPVFETKKSNLNHRPIGLGIQGLADILVLLRIPYDSDKALDINSKIMETIYLASMTASNDIAIQREIKMIELKAVENFNISELSEYYDNNFDKNNILYHELKPQKKELNRDTILGSYSSFDGSLYSEGKFQFDMWDINFLHYNDKWNILRNKVIKHGTRNSLLTALMPTASTSQILGNNECFEFFTNNIYTRKTHAGDFILVNKYLVNDLIKLNLWNINLKDKIIAANGSIQNLDEIPIEIKNIYKTIWEIKQIWVLKGALARAPFVDQSQSMNIFMAEPDYQRLSSSHFWGWKNGLKTGIYYLRTKPSIDPIKFTIDPNLMKTDTICENCSG